MAFDLIGWMKRLLVAIGLFGGLAGCGINAVEAEVYSLKSELSGVVAAAKNRQVRVQELIEAAGGEEGVGKGLVDRLKVSVDELEKSKVLMWQSMSNDNVGRMDQAMVNVMTASDAVVAAVSKKDGSATVGSKLWRVMEEEAEARQKEVTARTRYTIEVQVFNEVISIYPLKLGAMFLGEKKRVGLSEVGSTEVMERKADRVATVATKDAAVKVE